VQTDELNVNRIEAYQKMENKHYISFIIPALNEEQNLEDAVRDIELHLSPFIKRSEIIVVDDGSTDRTREIAERLHKEGRVHHVIHHIRPYGIGFSYRDGVLLASGDYVVMIPGDNEIIAEELQKALPYLGQYDFVIPYTENTKVRDMFRRFLSRTYNWIIKLFFLVNIKYSNGAVVYRREIFDHLNIVTDGFTFQAEIIIKAIRLGYSYKEVGVNIRPRPYGKSKAVRLINFYNVFWCLVIMIIEIYILRKYSYKVKTVVYE